MQQRRRRRRRRRSPIVVGYVWRRLAAKCAYSYAISKLHEFFSSVQVGVGVPGGCEAAVHAAQRFVENMGADYVLVKLDSANAFNRLHRDHMLNIVKEFVPEIYWFAIPRNATILHCSLAVSPCLLRSVLDKETHWLVFYSDWRSRISSGRPVQYLPLVIWMTSRYWEK